MWRPTTAELEVIADATTARIPIARLAARLGVTEDAFAEWAKRIASAPPPDEREWVPDYSRPGIKSWASRLSEAAAAEASAIKSA